MFPLLRLLWVNLSGKMIKKSLKNIIFLTATVEIFSTVSSYGNNIVNTKILTIRRGTKLTLQKDKSAKAIFALNRNEGWEEFYFNLNRLTYAYLNSFAHLVLFLLFMIHSHFVIPPPFVMSTLCAVQTIRRSFTGPLSALRSVICSCTIVLTPCESPTNPLDTFSCVTL